jgi:hypothetical protein
MLSQSSPPLSVLNRLALVCDLGLVTGSSRIQVYQRAFYEDNELFHLWILNSPNFALILLGPSVSLIRIDLLVYSRLGPTRCR